MNNLDFLMNNLIAHRGYWDMALGIPENSISSFKRAIEYKYPIELDIHVLKDNTVVVFHDDNLKRMTGLNKEIADCTYSEIKKLYLQGTQEKIPTLKEVLELVNGKVPLLIEFKSDGHLKELEKEAMKLLINYKGKFGIQSFNPLCVNYFKKYYPNIPRGQLSHSHINSNIPFIAKFALKNMIFNIFTKPDFISYDISNCNKNKILKWEQKRMVFGWTVRSKEQYEENKKIFDNLIGENMEHYIHKTP